jgi:hypothetical protein
MLQPISFLDYLTLLHPSLHSVKKEEHFLRNLLKAWEFVFVENFLKPREKRVGIRKVLGLRLHRKGGGQVDRARQWTMMVRMTEP